MDLEKIPSDEFNLVNMIQRENGIITNEVMVKRVQKIHKNLAIYYDEYQEDFLKLLLELNEIQLTTMEGFLYRHLLKNRILE